MNRMERLVFLPIAMSMGCTSGSSVAVFQTHHTKKSKPQQESPNDQQLPIGVEQGENYNLSSEKMKNSSLAFLSLPKPNISSGLQRLVKSFKNLSQLFVYKDESEELEMDIQIGFPTDVKHVTHIGWDGSNTTSNPLKGWNDLKSPEIVTIPTLSLRQFELAMAAQAEAPVC